MEEPKSGIGIPEMRQIYSNVRVKSSQLAIEEQKCGNGRATIWQWKSRSVAMEEQELGNGSPYIQKLASWEWKSREGGR